jgi:hypothetical protein
MTEKVYSPDDGAEVELAGIDGTPLYNEDGTPMTITVLGVDSDVCVAAKHATGNLRMKQGARGVQLTSETMDAQAVSLLVKCTTGWNITPSKLVPGIDPGLGEGKVPFNAAAVNKLYSNRKLQVIRDQLDTAMTERARFMKASPAT